MDEKQVIKFAWPYLHRIPCLPNSLPTVDLIFKIEQIDPLSPSSYVLSRLHCNMSCKLPVTEHPSVTSLTTACDYSVTTHRRSSTSHRSIHAASLFTGSHRVRLSTMSSLSPANTHHQQVPTNFVLLHTLVFLTTDCRTSP